MKTLLVLMLAFGKQAACSELLSAFYGSLRQPMLWPFARNILALRAFGQHVHNMKFAWSSSDSISLTKPSSLRTALVTEQSLTGSSSPYSAEDLLALSKLQMRERDFSLLLRLQFQLLQR